MTSKIFQAVAPKSATPRSRSKITVIGVGSVGMASAFALMEITSELVLLDVDEKKVMGEVLDLQQGQQFLQRCVVHGGTDYAASAGSDIVVISAGARQVVGESRLQLVQRNVDVFKKIIPNIVKHSPNCILVVVSNPVDVLTYIARKLSGFPDHRVLGTGTMLDSARFRYMLGEKMNISPNSIHGYVIGEHGDSSVPVWSNVSVAGVRLSTLNPQIGTASDPEKFGDIHKEVVDSAYRIIELKGYTSWAIGLCSRTLCNAILTNSHRVYPVSALAKGVNGIQDDIFTSLPCVITSIGVSSVIQEQLNETEMSKLHASAKALKQVIDGIKW